MSIEETKRTAPCPICNGQGRHSRDPKTGRERRCERCNGSGVISVPDKS